MDTDENRRQHERFPFGSKLEVRRRLHDHALAASALDVSVGGFGFRCALPLAIGELIAVTLPEAIHEDDALDAGGHREGPDLEIVAVVRHVHRQDGAWVIGAERRGDPH